MKWSWRVAEAWPHDRSREETGKTVASVEIEASGWDRFWRDVGIWHLVTIVPEETPGELIGKLQPTLSGGPTFQGCQHQGLTISDSSSYGVWPVRTYERSCCAVNSGTGIMEHFRAQMIGLWVGQTSIAKLLHCWTLVFLWFYCGVIKYATFFILKEPTVERLWMSKVSCVFEVEGMNKEGEDMI